MAAFYKSQGKDLLDRLDEIYRKFGMCIDKTHNYFFEGPYGGLKMARVMDYFRSSVERTVGSQEIAEKTDYMGETGLPKSDVLRYRLEDGTEFVIRPSGTEPKLKLYIFQSKAGGELDKEIGKIIAEQSASV